jgi:hypothetical protein
MLFRPKLSLASKQAEFKDEQVFLNPGTSSAIATLTELPVSFTMLAVLFRDSVPLYSYSIRSTDAGHCFLL